MSRYDWPLVSDVEPRDDPAGRARFVRPRRTDFDPEGAQRAGRAGNAPARRGGGGMRAPQSGREHLWQPLGPETLLNGQAEGSPRVSGRINALAVHSGGQRVYAASANGGVWYSSDGGEHWSSVAGLASTETAGILRPAQRNACGAIHVVFGATESDDLVFLGTGEVTSEPKGQPGDAEVGIGILVATGPAQSALPDPWVREAPNLVNNGVYRIASGGGAVIAATKTGLFQRPASPGTDVDWVRPSSAPFDSLDKPCADILFTEATGGAPARHWVWVKEGGDAGLWVRSGGSGAFTKVAVDPASGLDYTASMAALAASTPPTQIWVLNDRGDGVTPALFRVTNPSSGAPIAHGVVGVPDILHDQGFYDIAIAVDPANPNRVALGGSWFGDPHDAAQITLVTTLDGAKRGYDAAIVVADVAPDPANSNILTYGQAAPFTMIGMGAHPDVHALAYSNGGASLWTGCDGGVFRSDHPTSTAGFYSCNRGLSISESNYIGVHPLCEGHIVAGLQDNGVVMRASSGVWTVEKKGDGGGVIMDAARPDRWMAQYVRGSWKRSTAGGSGPITRGGAVVDSESNRSAFYSSAACIRHTRPAAPGITPEFSQAIIGTDRLWYSDDFGASWVTLPSGTDPIPANNPTQDAFGEAITVCRWQNPDVAWVLGEGTLKRYARTAGSNNAGGAGTWANPVETVIRKNVKNKKDATSAEGPIRDAVVWTDIAVNLDPPAAPNGAPQQHGTKGAIYLGTVGKVDNEDVDTLWWFDGTANWFPTGLRRDDDGVPAPVTAIACDPAHPEEVWVGTTVGVWRGVRTQVGTATPTWEWEARVNGLPEAAVEDLAIFRDGDLVLLRAAIAARGVWELRLDVADVQDRAYLRAHDDDLRHRDRAVSVKRDLVAQRSWHGSPDVRPRVASAFAATPASLPWARVSGTIDPEALRRFQAAFRASTGDKRIVANGQWDGYFSEVLREHGAPTAAIPANPPLPALSQVQISADFWNAHMVVPHATAEPWGAGLPSEADLHELTKQLREGEPASASCSLPAAPLKIDILVHHRGLGTLDGASVRVTLLRWIDPATPPSALASNSGTWFTGDVAWTAAVNEVLNSEGAAGGKTALALGAGWSFVLGDATESHRITLAGQTIDPTHAGVATFDLDASMLPAGTVVLLVAIIRAGTSPSDDIALAADELRDVVFDNPGVAARSIEITG